MEFGRRWTCTEIHESSLCPPFLRSAVVETLEVGWTSVPTPSLALSHAVRHAVVTACREGGAELVLDMASGAGGPLPAALGSLPPPKHPHQEKEKEKEKEKEGVHLILTDYFPQLELWQAKFSMIPNVSFCSDSVDATALDVERVVTHAHIESSHRKPILRTICGAMHHFNPKEMKSIMRDAIHNGDSVLFLEALERTPFSLFFMPLVAMLLAYLVPLLLLPQVVTSRDPSVWKSWVLRCLFTLIPVIPVVLWIDAVLSTLRLYTHVEWEELVQDVDEDRKYRWKYEKRSGPLGLGVLVSYHGVPKERNAK
jgi:hypothetical protein